MTLDRTALTGRMLRIALMAGLLLLGLVATSAPVHAQGSPSRLLGAGQGEQR